MFILEAILIVITEFLFFCWIVTLFEDLFYASLTMFIINIIILSTLGY